MTKRKKLDRPVLAEGEATGHAHVAVGATVFEEEDGTRTVIAHQPTEIVHEEHGNFTIPAGEYVADRVRELDPFAEEARRVAD